MNLKDDITMIIKWLNAARAKVNSILDEHSADKLARAGALMDDINGLTKAYMRVLADFVPSQPIEPLPKNWINRFLWLGRNLGWLRILVALTTGQNPFENVRNDAKALASKWGFANEVYGS